MKAHRTRELSVGKNAKPHLGDQMTLISRGPKYPCTMNPHMVYEPRTILNHFWGSCRPQGTQILKDGPQSTCGPLSSSFLGSLYRILSRSQKKELLWGLWVVSKSPVDPVGLWVSGIGLPGTLPPVVLWRVLERFRPRISQNVRKRGPKIVPYTFYFLFLGGGSLL